MIEHETATTSIGAFSYNKVVKVLPKSFGQALRRDGRDDDDNDDLNKWSFHACSETECTEEEMECIYIGSRQINQPIPIDSSSHMRDVPMEEDKIEISNDNCLNSRPNDPIASTLLVNSSADETEAKDDMTTISPTSSEISELTLSPVLSSRVSYTIETSNQPLFSLGKSNHEQPPIFPYYHQHETHYNYEYQRHQFPYQYYHQPYPPHRYPQGNIPIPFAGHPHPQSNCSNIHSKNNENTDSTTSKYDTSTPGLSLRTRCQSEVAMNAFSQNNIPTKTCAHTDRKELYDTSLQRQRSWSDGAALNINFSNHDHSRVPFPSFSHTQEERHFALNMRR